MVDRNSLTWKAVEKFIRDERKDAIDMLVADKDSDKQRGALIILERLESLETSQHEME